MSRATLTRKRLPLIADPGHAPMLAVFALSMLALSACSLGSSGSSSDAVGPSGAAASGSGPDLATQQACRQRVNEMYETRDRGDIYAANPSINTPSSANSYVGVPSHGLSAQFGYDQEVAACEHNAENGADNDRPLPAPPAPKRP